MITDHVVSLELAKQLHEKGIVVESEYGYYKVRGQWKLKSKGFVNSRDPGSIVKRLAVEAGEGFGNYYPAPLASELGEILPDHIQDIDGWWDLNIGKLESEEFGVQWGINYNEATEIDHELYLAQIVSNTLQDAMAKMLLYLKERDLFMTTTVSACKEGV